MDQTLLSLLAFLPLVLAGVLLIGFRMAARTAPPVAAGTPALKGSTSPVHPQEPTSALHGCSAPEPLRKKDVADTWFRAAPSETRASYGHCALVQ